jgi:hypothetical protein
MKFEYPCHPAGRSIYASICLALFAVIASGCAQVPSPVRDHTANDAGTAQVLAYYQSLGRLSAGELARERTQLSALPQTPNTLIRQAMVIGYPRAGLDSGKALALVDSVLKSADPAATGLLPVARLLADHYTERLRLDAERLRLDAQLERQGVQLKESQRKAAELQEKLDGLADIERTLTSPPRSDKPTGPGGK